MADVKNSADDSSATATAPEGGSSSAGSNGTATSVPQTGSDRAAEPAADKPAAQEKADAKADAKDPEKAREKKPRKDRQVGRKLLAGANALRSRIATVVWLIAVVCALFLAIGALLVALKMNGANPIVGFVKDGARALDLGTFKSFTGKNALIKDRLTNWGIAAVLYLIVGRILDRIIRP